MDYLGGVTMADLRSSGIVLLAVLVSSCATVAVTTTDSGPDQDAAADAHDASETEADAGIPETSTFEPTVYCHNFVLSTNTWPNGPYQSAVAEGCDEAGTNWFRATGSYQEQAYCSFVTCPSDDGLPCIGYITTENAVGSICCEALHPGMCQ